MSEGENQHGQENKEEERVMEGVIGTLSCLRCKAQGKEVASTGNRGKDTITLAATGDDWRQGD